MSRYHLRQLRRTLTLLAASLATALATSGIAQAASANAWLWN